MRTFSLCCLALSLFAGPAAAKGDPDKGTALEPTKAYDATMIKTALSANWHIQAVSKTGKKAVKEALKGAGWKLLGKVLEPKGVKDGRAYVAVQGDTLVVVFRGSRGEKWWETGSNALTDMNTRKEKPKWLKKHDRKVRVHKGFSNEYSRFRDQIIPKIKKHKKKRIFVVGFSLGAGLAQLCALDIKLNTKAKKVYLYPHASPRVGEKDFRALLEAKMGRIDRVILDGDPVPRLPPKVLAFKHAGRLLLLNPKGDRKNDHVAKTKVSLHDYDKYRTALKKHLKKCKKQCKKGALKKAANNTR